MFVLFDQDFLQTQILMVAFLLVLQLVFQDIHQLQKLGVLELQVRKQALVLVYLLAQLLDLRHILLLESENLPGSL